MNNSHSQWISSRGPASRVTLTKSHQMLPRSRKPELPLLSDGSCPLSETHRRVVESYESRSLSVPVLKCLAIYDSSSSELYLRSEKTSMPWRKLPSTRNV
jgi:hypothetical protein